MTMEVIKDQAMSSDFESDWIPVQIDKIANFGKNSFADSLQIYWEDVTGTLDGKIELFISNVQDSMTLGNTYNIETASNIDDSEFIVLSHILFKYLKIKYTKNNITGGKLNAILAFSDIK